MMDDIDTIGRKSWRDEVYATEQGLKLLIENGTPRAMQYVKDIMDEASGDVVLATPAKYHDGGVVTKLKAGPFVPPMFPME